MIPIDYINNAYHLAEKIYKPYQNSMIFSLFLYVPEGNEAEVEQA